MNLKESLSKEQLKSAAIIALIIFNLGIIAYLFIQRTEPNLPVEYYRNSRNQGESDPYIKNEVNNTISKNTGKIQACYNKFLESKPIITDGKVVVDWQVEPDGDPYRPEVVQSDFADQSFGECIVAEIKSWNFPEPPTGRKTYVFYKFFFKKTE
ncbi:AgmX/PglI C-terminal domain-containing protein [Leptospira andrefontaineae]|uniref:Uncharacterized protein n=1 Tax=Leptospira andrefontaineae TaxID=2484976 RepID=A0A4R9HCW2_9LEPT|nr:AgmX/PglI C-terminal domain-containing protein [Leptospira andrefontaineae]TGK44686.1 hypothetical protein EHO65_01205 [Leptospira andrefontaineae]